MQIKTLGITIEQLEVRCVIWVERRELVSCVTSSLPTPTPFDVFALQVSKAAQKLADKTTVRARESSCRRRCSHDLRSSTLQIDSMKGEIAGLQQQLVRQRGRCACG